MHTIRRSFGLIAGVFWLAGCPTADDDDDSAVVADDDTVEDDDSAGDDDSAADDDTTGIPADDDTSPDDDDCACRVDGGVRSGTVVSLLALLTAVAGRRGRRTRAV